ncbi:MAG: hypothetical protein GY754_01185 [bacterium]|nr:hypothetical protein [bacterium]
MKAQSKKKTNSKIIKFIFAVLIIFLTLPLFAQSAAYTPDSGVLYYKAREISESQAVQFNTAVFGLLFDSFVFLYQLNKYDMETAKNGPGRSYFGFDFSIFPRFSTNSQGASYSSFNEFDTFRPIGVDFSVTFRL